MQSVFWGRELQAIGQDLDTQRLPPQLEKGGVEGRPQHPNSPQHGLQGPHIIHHIAVNCSLKEDGAVLVDMSLFAKPTITCNMDFSFFPFDVQRCLLKIQVFKRNLRKTFLMLQASQSRDRLDLKILSGLNYSHGFEISTDWNLKTWVAATWLLSSRTPTSTMRSRFITYLKRCAKFFFNN